MDMKMVGIGIAAVIGLVLLSKGGGDGGGGSTQRFGTILGNPMQTPGETGGTGGVTYQFPQESFKGFEKLNLWQPDWEVDKDPEQGAPMKKIVSDTVPRGYGKAFAAAESIPYGNEGKGVPIGYGKSFAIAESIPYGDEAKPTVKKTPKREPSYKRSQAFRSGRVKVGKGMSG